MMPEAISVHPSDRAIRLANTVGWPADSFEGGAYGLGIGDEV